jgi:uncharacterized integral membrane protein
MFKAAEEMEKDGAEQMKKVIEEAAAQSGTATCSSNKSITIFILSVFIFAIIVFVFILKRKSRAKNAI